MFRVLYNGKSAMMANQEKLDYISNNLANMNTNGYKKVDVSFKDLMKESLDRKGYPVNSKGAYTGSGVRTSTLTVDNTQGTIQESNITSNLALDGNGMFKVIRPDGSEAYTRNGAFKLDSLGRMVSSNGDKLYIEYENGYNETNTKLTEDNFIINKNGDVQIKTNGNLIKVGNIPVFTAIGSDSFKAIGNSLYTVADGATVDKNRNVDLLQGYVESSNVDMAKEFTDMIITQRAFELGSRTVKMADEMWGMANNLRSK